MMHIGLMTVKGLGLLSVAGLMLGLLIGYRGMGDMLPVADRLIILATSLATIGLCTALGIWAWEVSHTTLMLTDAGLEFITDDNRRSLGWAEIESVEHRSPPGWSGWIVVHTAQTRVRIWPQLDDLEAFVDRFDDRLRKAGLSQRTRQPLVAFSRIRHIRQQISKLTDGWGVVPFVWAGVLPAAGAGLVWYFERPTQMAYVLGFIVFVGTAGSHEMATWIVCRWVQHKQTRPDRLKDSISSQQAIRRYAKMHAAVAVFLFALTVSGVWVWVH